MSEVTERQELIHGIAYHLLQKVPSYGFVWFAYRLPQKIPSCGFVWFVIKSWIVGRILFSLAGMESTL